mmetsp:Transcript_1157/g.1707  ORF Transcript_1157/g.1707 Transcript_1157/m.1707 type:complete len:141 (+) Transcript_1157:58-480(+)
MTDVQANNNNEPAAAENFVPEEKKKFKERHTFEERLAEAQKKKTQNPKLVPVIVERHERSKLPDLEKSKFLVSGDLKQYEFLLNIKQKLKLNKTEALYFFSGSKRIDKPNTLIKEIYEVAQDKDEFLYITYAELETFGSN